MLVPPASEAIEPFPIVAVGASAGGLDAFTQLLRHLPANTGFGFVLIQHLDRLHSSFLSETLSKVTAMPVRQAEHDMRLEPNHVYVIPPNADLAMGAGKLVLSPRSTDDAKPHLPVDFFMQSLARELGSRAIGVVLSGSASDGTEGLRAIQEHDGITFAQAPDSAKFPGMPQSAVDARVVDYGVPILQLAEELTRLSEHPYLQSDAPNAREPDEDVRQAIFARVRADFGVDFSEFKQTTVRRRLARRLALRRVRDVQSYLALLAAEPGEVRALYEDMLIHVTAFFRDPEVFEALRAVVFPEIVKHKAAGMPVRVWVAGCSTGEEVYSLAMTWLDLFGRAPATTPVINFFGSDVSDVAVQKARVGIYSDAAMREVSEERRARYFTAVEGGYRINKAIRDLCLFARHDLVRGPPFSKLDIVSCRNVLIYFDQALHKEVLPTLHYALNQPGFLVLGRSESIGSFGHLFTPLDKANKIFVRSGATGALPLSTRTEIRLPAGMSQGRSRSPSIERAIAYERHLDRLLLARYCPPGVLINANLDVLLFRGKTGAYLQAAPGQPQSNLIGMARDGLLAALRATLEEAKRERMSVRCPAVEVGQDGSTTLCDLVVVPFSGLPESDESLFIVLFEDSSEDGQRAAPKRSHEVEPDAPAQSRRIARLQHELAATKEYLHTLIDEHNRASDELGASNEELVSGNEELQSMNEELETAKEELQSINEELTTLNDELRIRNQEATQAISDLANFAATVDIPILTLDLQRRVRRFTPQARTILNVLQADVGRSIDDIKLNIDVPDLSDQIAAVIRDAVTKESEVQDASGRWYRMLVRPHTDADQVVDGAIVSLVDVNALKALIVQGNEARAEAERANAAKDDFLATLSHELRTPLSSMLLNAQQLRSGKAMTQEEVQHSGERLERSTLLQVNLIDDLLDVSRIVAGKLTLTRYAVDLGSVVEAAIDEVAALAAEKSLVVNVALQAKLEPVMLDRMRSQQIVTNLLTNAIKFTPRGGQITVVVHAEAGAVHLRVTDTGVGIEPSFLPHVFARFSQRDSTITRRHGGLGLGLALVRHLVEAQGGSVRAQSAGVNQGATFSISFPVQAGTARPADATTPFAAGALDRPGRAQHYEALQGLRILFVDDDLRTREAVLEVLHLAGAEVAAAASAAEGRRVLEAFHPQVILCDIAMPDEDGYAFIRRLRASPADQSATIPALALTALASEDDRRRALAAGFQMHLAKPIDIDRLREAVRALSSMTVSSSAPREETI